MIEGTVALVRPVEVSQSSTFHPLRNWLNARLVLKEEFAAQGIIWAKSTPLRANFQLLALFSATANWHCLEFPKGGMTGQTHKF
jgi:hypothetical protein